MCLYSWRSQALFFVQKGLVLSLVVHSFCHDFVSEQVYFHAERGTHNEEEVNREAISSLPLKIYILKLN